MFSSSNNNNINSFPNLASSSNFPFLDGEAAPAAGYFPFHHHHHHPHDPLFAGYLVPLAGPNYNYAAGGGALGVCRDEEQEQIGHEGKKPPARKDRHSKISTSQGLRDRRVRLSIGISREFFDLQDMLGFDTASKTLEWLLGKSRKDIEELEEQIKIKNKNGSSSSSLDPEITNEEEDEGQENPSHEKKVKKSPKDVFARESRAKARERARERTREKLCTSKSCPPNHCHHHHNQHSNPNPYGFTQLGSHNNVNNNIMGSFLGLHEKPSSSNRVPFSLHHHQQQQQLRESEEEEAIVTQRKLMSARGFVDWDISNAIRRSTISGATNLSTELQMYGNP